MYVCVCVRVVPCSISRRTTNMNSIVYNKYPIMIAATGNMPQPPTVKIHKHIHTYRTYRTNWINYENHENWVNSFWLNNCPAFVGHRTGGCISLFFFFFCISPLPFGRHGTCYVPPMPRGSMLHAAMPHATCNYNALIKTKEFHAAISCHLM